jgi:hypothetical protein
MPVPDQIPTQNPYGPQVSFLSSNVQPPSAIYLSPTDAIVVQTFAATTDSTVSVTYRILRPDGQLITSSLIFTTNFAGSNITTRVLPPTEGFLLSMVVASTGFLRGQCFAKVFLAPDATAANIATLAHLVLMGYVSVSAPLAFPQSVPENELNGKGWLRLVTGGGGVGVLPTINVPANVRWIFRAARWSLTTSAAAGTRTLGLAITDPFATRTFVQFYPGALLANETGTVNFAPGAQLEAAGLEFTTGFAEELIMPAGWGISGRCNNLDVGDTSSALFLTVEEFQAQ